jgi:predicted SnoaL-like aldol condensation-catalyzing enzyme
MHRQIAEDLLEALKALKACRNIIDEYIAVSTNIPDRDREATKKATRILDKYPNLK